MDTWKSRITCKNQCYQLRIILNFLFQSDFPMAAKLALTQPIGFGKQMSSSPLYFTPHTNNTEFLPPLQLSSHPFSSRQIPQQPRYLLDTQEFINLCKLST